ncbi:MAG: stage II sporulation protein M [Synechococcales bacterium]|nr:stage II sporulation protein M [Synechococcales bacterium]
MNVQRWIARRETSWKRLNALLIRIEKGGLKSLSAADIREMSSLYRSVSADLARARTHELGLAVVQDLQMLTARAYSQVYQGSQRQDWRSLLDFISWGFPEIVRRTGGYTAIATAIFLTGGLVAWWFAWTDPSFIPLLVPGEMITMVRDRQELWMGSILGQEPLASSNIMINNLSVSFRAVAGGITAGIFTVYILAINGLFIGTVATLVGQGQLAYPFWAFVFPHGALELPAIFLSGGAGLLIARAMLLPGRYRRVDALAYYGRQAAQLVFGIVPLLAIAGVIEGFFSPSPLVPAPLKYVTGTGLFVLLVMYCRRQRPQNLSKSAVPEQGS